MPRTLLISALLVFAAAATAQDIGGSITVTESLQVTDSDDNPFALEVARGGTADGLKLIINKTDEPIAVFDANMTRISLVKPQQTLEVSKPLTDQTVVALSIGGGYITYVDFSGAIVVTATQGGR